MVRVTIINAIITIPILAILIYFLNLTGIAIYFVIGSLVPVIIMLFYIPEVFSKELRIENNKLSNSEIKSVFHTGITSLLAFLFSQLVILYLRKFIIGNFGIESNGIYQSVLGLSLNLFAFMYSFLGNHTLTQLSIFKIENIENDTSIISILDDTVKFLLVIMVPLIVLLYSYRSLVILILYSNLFSNASDIILYQLIGDFFRIFASLFSLWLFSRKKIKQLILIDLIFNLLLIILPNIFIQHFPKELKIVPISYLISSAVQFILFYSYSYKVLKFKFTTNAIKSISLSVVTIIVSIYISNYYAGSSYYFAWIIIFIWGLITLKYIENISIKNSFKKIFNKLN